MRTDVGGNIFKLQLNPHQLMSQGCDSQAETTWREGGCSSCPSCLPCPHRLDTSRAAGALLSHPPKALQGQPALAREQTAEDQGYRGPPTSAKGSTAMQAGGGTCRFGVQPRMNCSRCGLETHGSSKSSKLCFQGKRRMETCFFYTTGLVQVAV